MGLQKALRIVLFTMVSIIAASSYGATVEQQSFTVSGKNAVFVHVPSRHLTVSKSCEKSPGIFECQAYSALHRASLRGVLRPRGGANPGALICDTKVDGQVVMGRDKDGNENSFCLFSDGSMVSSGSLSYYGRKNDLKKIE